MEEYLEPEEVVPGMIGIDYSEEPGTVKMIKCAKDLTAKDLTQLVKYDDTGWLPNSLEEFKDKRYREEENFIDDDTWLVAIQDEHQSYAVFVYGGEGFIVPATERWKNSKLLSNVNHKTGVLESLKRLKSFKDF